ncbi:MAG: T9SS C-terminal target domain-containing protein [Ignavibacteriae bacterium]|nr:MAG: T9SS C-terminal target domain-containing protein [Ignavibacteriota bacterium]
MKYLISLLFCFLITQNLFAEDAFFYNNGIKLTLHPSDKYIAVKFDANEPDANKNIITRQLTGASYESTVNFNYSHSNSNRQAYVVIKLKDNTGDSRVNDIISLLLLQKRVLFAGRAYVYNDHVIHIPTNEVIVKFKKDISSFDANNLTRLFKASIIEKINTFDNAYVVSISSRGENGSDNPFDISNKFSINPLVEFAQPNFIRIGMLTSVPNDTLIPQMWNIHNTGHNYPTGITTTPGCDMRVDSAWNITTGDQKVLIGIIDTGTDTNHYDLKNKLCDRDLWYNAVDENHNPQDGHSHGTAMCGIAGAEGDNIAGIAGVAWGCLIMPIRIFSNEAFTTDLILGKGINWGWTHGASVLNNSWGGGLPAPFIEHAIRNAVKYGRNGKGTVVFAATGNDNNDTIIFPSRMPEVIAVGGVGPCNQRKSLTSCDNEEWGANYGENLSIVAPTPRIGCTGLGGGWSTGCNGTSSACPQVTAIGALILTKNINMSADSVRIVIERSARKIGDYSYTTNMPNGLWNNEMGYGMINAYGALNLTQQGPVVIYDQIPPVIQVYSPPPANYSNTEIIINADIYDNQKLGEGISGPRLYYTSTYNSNVNSIAGVKGSGNTYSFTIPRYVYGTIFNYYVAAQDTSSNHNITTIPYGGNGINPPGRIAPLKKIFLLSADTFDSTIVSTNVPILISQMRETTFVSSLYNPVNSTVAGIRCTINVEHAFAADLTFSLISPEGTEIVLTSGTGWDGDNFINTVFDDYASVSITDTSYHPPYTGSFRPVENLWMLNGENSLGEWKLKVVDNGIGDGGALNSWSVTFLYPKYNNLSLVPSKSELINNYPNPFNPYTRILFNLAKRSNVKIKIYDAAGREVATLINEIRDAGFKQAVDFNPSNINGGNGIASGIYFYTLIVDDEFIESKKMALVK